MTKPTFSDGVWTGVGLVSGLNCIRQDVYGLEGYITYLRANWIEPSFWTWSLLVVCMLVVSWNFVRAWRHL